MRRRHFLQLCGLGPGMLAVASPLQARQEAFRAFELKLYGDKDIAQRALVLVPPDLDPARPPRLALMLHGYGPSTPWRAIRTWRDHYGAVQAHRRLASASIEAERFRYMPAQRGAELEAALGERPYQGLVLVCPETVVPYFRKPPTSAFDQYADWVAETLLPEVRRRVPVSTSATETGLCGVSMGGYVGLELWLRRPDLFGAFCGLQSDVKQKRVPDYAERIQAAVERVGGRKLRFVTSTRDPYRQANTQLSAALDTRGIASELRVARGPHNSAWMRQVGSVEALFWLDRVLQPPAAIQQPADAPEGPARGGQDEIAEAPRRRPTLL